MTRDGTMNYKIEYNYNASKDILEENYYDASNKLLYKEVYFYNSDGKKIAIEKRNAEGIPFLKVTYKYDDAGYLLEEQQFFEKSNTITYKRN